MPDPCVTVWLEGNAEREKSPVEAALTTNVTCVVWLKLPLAPVMVNVYVPVGVEPLVVTLIVVEPDPLTEVGVKLAPAPDGKPLTLKPTVPENPPDGVTVIP